MDETLTDKEVEIIEFINDKLFEYETKAKEELFEIVKEKYGSLGEDIWDMLEDDFPFDEKSEIEECSECGKLSEEWVEKIKKQMEQLEELLDDTYDELVDSILEKYPDSNVPVEYIEKKLKEVISSDLNINVEIRKIKKKILFRGILDGWLVDKNFN
jgi:hypothetical protein